MLKWSDRKAKRIENGVSVCEWQWGVWGRVIGGRLVQEAWDLDQFYSKLLWFFVALFPWRYKEAVHTGSIL